MTTYTPIANGSVDAGSPVDESLVTALRDNPIAISEGSTGAPKIQTAAYDANSVDQAAIESAIKAKYLIESVTMSGTTHTFATVSGYDRYRIEYEFTAGGGVLGMRVGNNTPASGYNYQYAGTYVKAGNSTVFVVRDTSNDYMYIGSQPDEAVGSIEIMGANQTGSYCYTKSLCSILDGGELFDFSVSSIYTTKNNANAFQIGAYGFGATTITGTARLYGYRN